MQFYQIATLAFASFVAAESESPIAWGIIYSKEHYKGHSSLLFNGCTQLKAPLLNNAHSIVVDPGNICRTFSLQNCFGDVNEYDRNHAIITGDDSKVNSVYCVPRHL